MTDNPMRDAIAGVDDAWAMVDTARNALATLLEDMGEHPGQNTGFCILRTLDLAYQQGATDFSLVEKSVKE